MLIERLHTLPLPKKEVLGVQPNTAHTQQASRNNEPSSLSRKPCIFRSHEENTKCRLKIIFSMQHGNHLNSDLAAGTELRLQRTEQGAQHGGARCLQWPSDGDISCGCNSAEFSYPSLGMLLITGEKAEKISEGKLFFLSIISCEDQVSHCCHSSV